MRYTIAERTFIVKSYYEGGVKNVRDLWDGEFNTEPPTRQQIYNVVHKFEKTGSVADAPRSGWPSTAVSAENEDRVALLLVEAPQTSSRRGALELDLARTSYRRIVKRLKFKCYTPRLTHGLLEDDPDRRLQFCELLLHEYRNNPDILNCIIFSDEAQFKLNGLVNRHNSVYYDTVNPHVTYEVQLNQPGVLVWAGFSKFGVFGPYFFESTCTGQSYLNMLQDYLLPGLCTMHSERMNAGTIYFQQDGAPAHYTRAVREYLDEQFQGRVIGRRGSIEWPPRSPDLTPLDFFTWGYVKDAVYARKPKTLEQLRSYIGDVFEDLDSNALLRQRVIDSMPGRLQDCVNVDGKAFEHYR